MKKKQIHGRYAVGVAVALALLVLAPSAGAQNPAWRPEKAVELIASSAPGGSNDKSARAVQKILQDEKILPVPVNVVNKTGGNQSLSRAYLSTHPGDPHYFNMANPTILANHIAGVTPQHHSDLTPVALLFNEYAAFTVRADSPIKNARELVTRIAQDPDTLAIGISNRGGTNHLALALLAKTAGIDPKRLKIVVFKGNSESITALLGGHIQLVASTVTSAIGQVQGGKARMISTASPRRLPGVLADVPTLREQGYDVALSNFRVLVGPKGLSAPQVAFWENAMARVVATEEWKKDLEKQYWEAHFLRSRDTMSYLDSEYKITRAVMAELGVAK